MAGELVPLVMLPRYTTYAGVPATDNKYFSTIAMDVTQYEKAILNCWRGKIVGTLGSPALTISFFESTDQMVWTACSGSAAGDPGENTEVQFTVELKKRWFQVRVLLGGADNVVSCWAVGFLEERLR